MDHFTILSKLYRGNCDDFQNIFKISLRSFWDIYTGFDIIGFDSFIGTPDGKSTKQHVLDNYGQKGIDLIMRLISPSECDKSMIKESK